MLYRDKRDNMNQKTILLLSIILLMPINIYALEIELTTNANAEESTTTTTTTVLNIILEGKHINATSEYPTVFSSEDEIGKFIGTLFFCCFFLLLRFVRHEFTYIFFSKNHFSTNQTVESKCIGSNSYNYKNYLEGTGKA